MRSQQARAGECEACEYSAAQLLVARKTAPRGFHTLMLCMQIFRTKSVRRVDEANLWIPTVGSF